MVYGIEHLRNKLATKKTRVDLRYSYYDMKKEIEYFSRMIPSDYGWLSHSLGWCGKAVDSLADRLTVNEFRNDNFYMNEIFQMNNADILFDSAILSALISSCSFIYIFEKDGFPALEVIDGANATGTLDETTGLLEEGYAVLERDDNGVILLEAYFEKGRTTYFPKNKEPYSIENVAPYPLLVPLIYRPDAKRVFGRSRITRACMSIQQSALRTLKRMEIASEFYSFPQKYIIGLDEDAEFNGRMATIASFLDIRKDADGDKPSIGQFTQQSMTPHIEQLRMCASLFSGETGLTLDDLGFPSDNPSSAEAIKATHENLRLSARKAQNQFAIGFINAGYLASCIRDEQSYKRDAIYQTKLAWKPIFELDSSAMSTVGDGLIKIQQAFPDYLTEEKLKDLFGF